MHPNVSLPELEPRLFSFNSPHGACPECHGLGTINEFDPELIVQRMNRSRWKTGAIEAWRKNGKRMNIFYSRVLRQFCRDFGISYTQPYKDIPKKVRDILMYGTDAKGDNGTGTVRRRHPQPPAPLREHRKRMGQAPGCTSTCPSSRARRAAARG